MSAAGAGSAAKRDDRTTAFACLRCGGELDERGREYVCRRCGATFPLIDRVPHLVAGAIDEHKVRQAVFFDAADAEFEITRPHKTTALYEWLIREKLRRGVVALRPILRGATALSVCGGSGMEAEFLARCGARVVLADISPGAAARARERARRFGFDLDVVVADAEQLPFPDRSFDIVYVHDGLHHLERPLEALAEMARVARRAVSVNEPARATVTQLAVRVGLSDVEEEAGNVIGRLDVGTVVAELERERFDVVRAARYAMVYRHEPGRASRLLSARPIFPLVQSALTAFNALAGGIGNKFTVQAIRR